VYFGSNVLFGTELGKALAWCGWSCGKENSWNWQYGLEITHRMVYNFKLSSLGREVVWEERLLSAESDSSQQSGFCLLAEA